MHLKLEDLLNVADANKYLRLATYVPFARKYDIITSKSISICYSKRKIPTRYQFPRKMCLCEWGLVSANLKVNFQVIRCFGQMIKDLRFRGYDEEGSNQEFSRICSYVREFCGESLSKMEFTSTAELANLQKPFSSVEEVRIILGSFPKKIFLGRIFPKLRYFKIQPFCNIRRIILEHFPNLNHLHFSFTWYRSSGRADRTGYIADSTTANNLLRLNPQVLSLDMEILDLKFFETSCELLQSIENFHLYVEGSKIFIRHKDFHFRNVKRLRIDFMRHIKIDGIPFSFDQLNELTLDGRRTKSEFGFHRNVLNEYLKMHPLIEKLTIKSIDMTSLPHPITLPSLKEFVLIPTRKLCIKSALEYLKRFKSLKSFSFVCCDTEDTVRKHCTNIWKVYRIPYEDKTILRLELVETDV